MIERSLSAPAFLAFTILLAAPAIFAAPAVAQQCPSVVWADEFDGTSLDTTKWEAQTGDGCAEGICGWGNNELQSYQAANVTVSGGTLKITAREQRIRNKQYTSGRIRTLGKGEWTYGRFEARLKLTQGQGIWPAFWMLPTDEVYGGWPSSGEIDIMENVGHEPETVHGTIHYGSSPQNAQQSGASFRLASGLFADGFHEFAVEKEPGVIRWFVDDVLFFTQTTADVSPANWPFDERFHFLLNVAVGGNWPGSPDATTVFPQVLEADYVRVYDGSLPHITGPRRVDHQAAGTVYSIGNAFGGSSFAWTVPAGATLVSGQGTDTVTVDWGTTGGAVTADVSSGCGAESLSIEVTVDPPYARDFSFENFDDPANATFASATGTLAEVANPDPSGVNPSAMSGDYGRNAAEQYDTIFYDVSVINDASQYESETKRFYLDVYSAVAPGTPILIQLEDSSLATSINFPTGRHSRYSATTTSQNQWQRLAFTYVDSPDPDTPDGGVDDLVILFAPDSFTGDTYFYDNLDSYSVATGGNPPAAPSGLSAAAASASRIDLAWTDNSGDEDGFRIERSTDGTSFTEIDTTGADVTAYADTGLAASTTYHYRVRAFNASGNSAYSNTASDTTQSGGSATTMHVESIVEGSQGAGQGNKRATATVTLVDNLGNPVASATVDGTFSGDFNETASGVTDASGSVTLVTTGVKKGSLTFTFCVDGVAHATLAYDPASNVQTCS